MQVFIFFTALLTLTSTSIVCNFYSIQPVTSLSSSLQLKITRRPIHNGSLVHTSELDIKQSSIRLLAMIKRPLIRSLSHLRFQDCPTWLMASKIIEVFHFLFRQWLSWAGILRNKKNRPHRSYLLSLHPNLRSDQSLAAHSRLSCRRSHLPSPFEHLR